MADYTGDAGNNSYFGTPGDDNISGLGGADRLIGNGGNDNIDGGDDDDYITGGFGDDIIAGGNGFDRAGWYQTNAALGGVTVSLQLQGTAQYTGSQGWDILTGIEYLSGTPFADTLTGDDNDNVLWGSASTLSPGNVSVTNNDIFDGAGGNDLITVGIGNHWIDGGSGIDTLSFTENFGDDPAVRINLALAGVAQDTTQGSWTISNIENLVGGTGNDELTGDAGDNVLAGYSGNDTLVGGAGNDTLLGDGYIGATNSGGGSGPVQTHTDANVSLGVPSGDDSLEGGLGNDTINGGGGIDTASYANAGGSVNVNLGAGFANGADGSDTLINIENVIGSGFNDTLNGSAGDNVLEGRGGNDSFFGQAGNDTIYGGDGDDFLRGDVGEQSITVSGNDILYGENGNDNLRGGLGDDQLYGGSGNDLMRGNGGIDHYDGGADDGEGFNGIGDRISFYDLRINQGVIADLRTGVIANDGYGNVESMVGIESLGSDSAYADIFHGNDARNDLFGNVGDSLHGHGGDDRFQTASAATLVDGGDGVDFLQLTSDGGWLMPDANADGLAETAAGASVGWTVDLSAGTTLDGYGQAGIIAGIENVNGHFLGDSLIGDANANVLNGLDGDDLIEGRGGDDIIDGGNGIDTASYASASGAVFVGLYDGGFGEAEGADGYDQLSNIENVVGSAFDDVITGDSSGNVLRGGDGNDTLRGHGGNDQVYGEGGNDFLGNGAGDDLIDGGDGFDRVTNFAGAVAGVTIDLRLQGVAQDTGQGMDTLVGIEHVSGTLFGDTLTGDEGDNWLWGSAATIDPGTGEISLANKDIIDGQGGNDLIGVGIGNHLVDGGSGIDTLYFTENQGNDPDVTINLALQGAAQATGQGNWTITNVENLSGGTGNDVLSGDGSDNVLGGNTGNDVLVGGAGNDQLYGDGFIGADTRPSGGSGPIALFADATDYDPAVVDGDDLLEGGLGDDQLWGGGGNDTASYANASGSVQAQLYNGGFGEAFGADGYDQLHDIENLTGSAHDDVLTGNGAANTVSGGDGADTLRGLGGNDSVLGGNGADFVNGGFGDDVVDGGAGIDRAAHYQTNAALGGVTVSLLLQGSWQNIGSQGLDYLTGVENLSGTPFADSLTGDANNNWLWGSPATISIGNVSAANNDMLDGGDGHDLFWVGIGNHSVIGGNGIDTLYFTENGSPEIGVTVSLAAAGAQTTGAGDWMLSGIENLSGGIENDTLTGDGNANVLAGNLGADTLVGGGGDDILLGDGRVDFDGDNNSVNILDSGEFGGDDSLEGGLGNDQLNGGAGADTASYANAGGSVIVHLLNGTAFGADGSDTLVSIENVIGSEFNDNINGSASDNVIEGRSGNDNIFGQAGNDTIYGGDGDDFLRGDVGEQSLTVSGNDILYGESGNDNLRGGLGDDQLYGGDGNDLMRGNGGIDSYDGGADGADDFNGIGDRISFYDQLATQGVVADLRTGIISNDGFGNVETMVGIESLGSNSAFADTFHGNDARNSLFGDLGDSIYGYGGNDRFQSSSAAAIIDGGDGIDFFQLTSTGGALQPDSDSDGLAEMTAAASAGWMVDLSAGTMLDGYGNVGAISGIEDVNGSELGDTLIGDGNTNVLGGLVGDDVLDGRGGNDTIDGGDGVDTASYANASGLVTVDLGSGSASGADGNDTLANIENVTGSAFDDLVIGNGGANALLGAAGRDYLRALGGDDLIDGGDGDDYLDGGAGNDTIQGGAGLDRVAYANGATMGVTVNLALLGPQNTVGAGMDVLLGIEHISGTIFADNLTGNGGDNWLWGGSDASGVTGNDTINGAAGNDLIEVGTGNHTLIGGTGNDTLSLYGNSTDITAAGITFSLAAQGAAQNSEQGLMNASGFENVSGSKYDDLITGDAGANILLGADGSDTLNGGDGNDTLYGDGRTSIDSGGTGRSGAIKLYGDVERDLGAAAGADGNDILNGGKGNDTIYGGRGNDVMSGGPGADRFIIEAMSGDDRILDFAHVDRIVFEGVAGVDDFTDLILAAIGRDTMISWGTDDSLLVAGYRPRDLTAADFVFAPSAASSDALLASLSHGSSLNDAAPDTMQAMALSAGAYMAG